MILVVPAGDDPELVLALWLDHAPVVALALGSRGIAAAGRAVTVPGARPKVAS